MKQIIQNLRDGELKVATIPEPLVRPGYVLIANACSVISAGTEKMAMDLARKSLLGKARERPDQVRRVLAKMRQEGILNTLSQVSAKLDEPMTLGYSSAGTVLACGAGVQAFKPGDRVASNGSHAGVVCVPEHLCALVPEAVPFDHAAFTVLGSIALQGVRLAHVELGSAVFVIGLGLVGQLAVAILKAQGCRVIGVDPDAAKCAQAVAMGADKAAPGIGAAEVMEFTRGLGADAVLITAATKSNGPIEQAAAGVRKKGRIVLVGVVGLEIDRRAFYFKEAEFVVSCSYGPGRYDPEYEERGHDYPAAYVRWTEQRNMQAVLDLMGVGRLNVAPLISHRFAIEKAEAAYQMIDAGTEPYLGIVIEYPEMRERLMHGREGKRSVQCSVFSVQKVGGKIRVGCLGAGSFARAMLIPGLKKIEDYHLRILCSAGGVSADQTGRKSGFESVTTNEDDVFGDKEVDAVFVLTRHNQHAAQVIKALQAGKHVFVEKPLCISAQELCEVEQALREQVSGVKCQGEGERKTHDSHALPLAVGDQSSVPPTASGNIQSSIFTIQSPILAVGFNRRFAPATQQVKSFFAGVTSPLTVSIRFNAGEIPAEHWTQDDETGGGRIIGEACHAVDLATFLVGSLPVRVFAESVGGAGAGAITDDQCFITLRHANGAISNIGYLAGGDKAYPKERVEVIGGGRVAVIDDFREVETCVGGRVKRTRLGAQDKGHAAGLRAFADTLARRAEPPMTWGEIRSVTLATILAVQSLREGIAFEVD